MKTHSPTRRIGRGFAAVAVAGTLIASLTPGTASATTASTRADIPCRIELYPVGGHGVYGTPWGYQAWLTCASPVQMMNLKIERAKGGEILAHKQRFQKAGPIELRLQHNCRYPGSWLQAVAVIKDTPTSPKRTIRSPQKYPDLCPLVWAPDTIPQGPYN